MAIPRTGARLISVEGIQYRWRVRRKATHSQTDHGTGCLHVAIELAVEPGTTAVVLTDRPHPTDWATVHVHPITPADVADWIRRSMELGWVPTAHGSPVFFKVEREQLERVV